MVIEREEISSPGRRFGPPAGVAFEPPRDNALAFLIAVNPARTPKEPCVIEQIKSDSDLMVNVAGA